MIVTSEINAESFLYGKIEKTTCKTKQMYLLRVKRLNIFTKDEAKVIKEISIYDKTPEEYISQIIFKGDIKKVDQLLKDPINVLKDVLSIPMTDDINRTGPQVIICVAYGGEKPYIVFASCSNRFIAMPKFIDYGIKTKVSASPYRQYCRVFERLCNDITLTELYKGNIIKYRKEELIGTNIIRSISGYIINTPVYEYKLMAPMKIEKLLNYIKEIISNKRLYTLCVSEENLKQLFPKDFYDAVTLNDGVKLVSDYNDMIKKYLANKYYYIIRVKIYVYNGQIIDLNSEFCTEFNLTNQLGKIVNKINS